MLIDKIPYKYNSGRRRKLKGRTKMWKETEANYFFSVQKGERDQKMCKKWLLLTGRKYLKYPLIFFQIGTKKRKKEVRSLQDL